MCASSWLCNPYHSSQSSVHVAMAYKRRREGTGAIFKAVLPGTAIDPRSIVATSGKVGTQVVGVQAFKRYEKPAGRPQALPVEGSQPQRHTDDLYMVRAVL